MAASGHQGCTRFFSERHDESTSTHRDRALAVLRVRLFAGFQAASHARALRRNPGLGIERRSRIPAKPGEPKTSGLRAFATAKSLGTYDDEERQIEIGMEVARAQVAPRA